MADQNDSGDDGPNANPEDHGSLAAGLELPSFRTLRSLSREDMTDLASLSSVELSEALAELEVGQQEVRELDQVRAPALVGTFSAKLDGDASTPMLYDVTLTSSGRYAVVTDCWNRCVKAFDLRAAGCPCRGLYPMKDLHPLCIASLSCPERVAVTLHRDAKILVLAVAGEEPSSEIDDESRRDVAGSGEGEQEMLSFHSVITTASEYRGIARLPSDSRCAAEAEEAGAAGADSLTERLVVTAPKEIHILDMTGSVLQVVVPTLCSLPLLNDAIYLAATPGGDLVVSDVGTKRVVCVDLSGRLRWFHPFIDISRDDDEDDDDDAPNDTSGSPNGHIAHAGFKGVQWPLGVATDEAGRVLVCDLELHSVVILSPGGAGSRLFLTETESLEYPRGLHLANGRLCLTQDHCIKLFSY